MRKLWTPGRDERRVRLVRNEAVMGNSERRRLLGGYEQDIWERRYWMKNAARTAARYAKRVVARRERREGRRAARDEVQ